MDFKIETVWLKNENQKNKLIQFLKKFDLNYENNLDYSVIIRDDKDNIIGSCSKSKNIIKCLAVNYEYRGYNLSASLVNSIIDKIFNDGYSHFFAFTEDKNIEIFQSLGFSKVFSANGVSLFENGIYGILEYLNKLYKKYNLDEDKRGSLVMNCNPMTLGHLHLIKYACENSREVLLFVVEEDKSIFSFKDRIEIIKNATKDIDNLKIIESSDYIISQATFPTYFLKEITDQIKIYTELDVSIFGKYFAKKLNINRRYVGKEPFDNVTNYYNSSMKKILPTYGVEVVEIERLKIHNKFVSASLVRKLIHDDNLEEAYKYLPKATIEFLNSQNGKKIINIIKQG